MVRLNEIHRAKARGLRQTMTKAEVLLWQLLRRKQMSGLRFRRQHPIGVYIADFACIAAKVVVELDGMSHEVTAEEDEQRTQMLRAGDWQVVRYTNHEILLDVDLIAADIGRICRDRLTPPPYPPPSTGEDTRPQNNLTHSSN